MNEKYQVIFGTDGWIAIGVCYPPFEPRLLFENLVSLKAHIGYLKEAVTGYEQIRDIPDAFKEMDKEV